MSKKVTILVLGLEAAVIGVLLLIALDQYAHKKVQLVGGLNSWGYRGRVAPQRVFDETRLVTVGGTQAFGFGMAARETATSYLRFLVEAWVTHDRGPVTAVNLALPGLPRGAYADRLRQFGDLSPDLICVYIDLAPNATAARHRANPSGVTRLTGYSPALPLVFQEKGDQLSGRGNPLGWVMQVTGRALHGLDSQLARFAGDLPAHSDDVTAAVEAVEVALGMAPSVVVVLPEPLSAAAARERDQLSSVLSRFSDNARVRVVRLGDRTPGYRELLLPDGVNLGAAGQYRAAVEIEPAVSELLRARRGTVKPS